MDAIDELLANNTAFAASPFLLHRDRVRGFVCDGDTHVLREVHVDAPG